MHICIQVKAEGTGTGLRAGRFNARPRKEHLMLPPNVRCAKACVSKQQTACLFTERPASGGNGFFHDCHVQNGCYHVKVHPLDMSRTPKITSWVHCTTEIWLCTVRPKTAAVPYLCMRAMRAQSSAVPLVRRPSWPLLLAYIPTRICAAPGAAQ